MDATDEIYLGQHSLEESGVQYYPGHVGKLYRIRHAHNCPELRLYEDEEDAVERAHYDYQSDWDSDWYRPVEDTPEKKQREAYYEQGVPYHFIRFCDSIKGFHSGSLDLSGRYQERHRSLMERFSEFVGGLVPLVANARPLAQGSAAGPQSRIVRMRSLDGSGTSGEVEVDEEPLAAFEKRWALEVRDLGVFSKLTYDLVRYLKERPEPIFQRIHLVDLPSELLSCIMEKTDTKTARQFGATCKLLHEVSHLYVRQYRFVGLKAFNLSQAGGFYPNRNPPSPEELALNVRNAAEAVRALFYENAAVLCSDDKVAQGITDLALRSWDYSQLANAAWESEESMHAFNMSISYRMVDVVNVTQNVRQLVLTCVPITVELVMAILSMPQLRYLGVMRCTIHFHPDEVQRSSSSIDHMSMNAFDPGLASYRLILPHLPNLRWLDVRDQSFFSTPWVVPPLAITETYNPFGTVERMTFTPVRSHEWEDLLILLHGAVPGGRLPLTHFKVTIDDSLAREPLFALITALARSSLQCLSLHGIDYAGVDLLEHIVQSLPDLVALTLVYREGPRQRLPRDACWPCPAWQYAAPLAGLPRLEYFGWNLRPDRIYSPIAMRAFETGDWCTDAYPSFDDTVSLPKLFAAYRPTLKTMAFLMHDGYVDLRCSIKPKPSGAGGVEVSQDCLNYDIPFDEYDPQSRGTWPPFQRGVMPVGDSI